MLFVGYFQARPLFKDRRKFPQMADPMLQGRYPTRGLYQALAVAAMCLQEQAAHRPLIGDVVTALTYLASQTYDPGAHSVHSNRFGSPTPGRDKEKKGSGGLEEGGQKATRQGGLRSPQYQGSPDMRAKDGVRQQVHDDSVSDSRRGREGSARKNWRAEILGRVAKVEISGASPWTAPGQDTEMIKAKAGRQGQDDVACETSFIAKVSFRGQEICSFCQGNVGLAGQWTFLRPVCFGVPPEHLVWIWVADGTSRISRLPS